MDGPPADETRDELEVLAFFHWAIAALAAFVGLLPVVYLGMALVAGIDPFAGSLRLATAGPPSAGRLAVAALAAAACFAAAAGLGLAAVRLRRAERWRFCAAMAVVSCLFVPFGTMLGLYTLSVLARGEVKSAFAR